MKVSVNCIARNEELHLENTLNSIAPYVDEIVFGDHYSIDNTLKVARKCAEKWSNIKIVEIPPGVNFADARNLLMENSRNDLVWKFDGDCLLINHEIIAETIEKLIHNLNYSCISYHSYNLNKSKQYFKKAGFTENYIHRKSSLSYQKSVRFPDNLTGDIRTLTLNECGFIHANNIKPMLNILFRCFMSEYSASNSTDNYFDWYYERKFGKKGTKEEVLLNISETIKYLIKHPEENLGQLSCHSDLEQIRNYPMDLFELNDDGSYKKAVLVMYGDRRVSFPEENWAEKLVHVIHEIDKNNDFDKFC